MDSETVGDLGVNCIAQFVAGDAEAAFESMWTLAKAEPGGKALFCATAGWATVVAEAATRRSPAARPLVFEVACAAPSASDDKDGLASVAAFLVAVGNDDLTAAAKLWASLGEDRAIGLATSMLQVVAWLAPPPDRPVTEVPS